jgi:hypothetical protein
MWVSGDCKYRVALLPTSRATGRHVRYIWYIALCASLVLVPIVLLPMKTGQTNGPLHEKYLTKLINYGRFKSARCGVRSTETERELGPDLGSHSGYSISLLV